MNDYPPVLVLDLSATGLGVARILSNHGISVYGTDIKHISIGRYSKYVSKPPFGFTVSLDDDFLSALFNFASAYNTKPILIPSSDVFIEYVSQYFDVLQNYYSFQNSLSPSISNKFLNKYEFFRICQDFNVPHPRTIKLRGDESEDYIIQNLQFPMIVKPKYIHMWKKYLKGNKVLLVNDRNDLREILKNERTLLADSMLQEVIPGPEENIYIFKGYFGKDAKLKATFSAKKIRQFPPYFGSFSLVETTRNEEIESISIEFLQAINFEGLCGSEFKYDTRDNIYKIIEINIRPQLWEDATRVSENEVLWVAYCDLADLDTPEIGPQKENIKYSYLLRDIYSGYLQIKDRELTFRNFHIFLSS